MSDLVKAIFRTPNPVSQADTTPDGPDPDPSDLWAFTDPDARDEYAARGQSKELERDIRFEVMRGGPWQPEELAFKAEVRRLLREGMVADKGTYWYRSPHPTVYRASRDGSLSILGKVYPFRAGDDVVFQCRMERDSAADDPGPVLIATLQPAREAKLCGSMPGAMSGMRPGM